MNTGYKILESLNQDILLNKIYSTMSKQYYNSYTYLLGELRKDSIKPLLQLGLELLNRKLKEKEISYGISTIF